MLMQVYRPHHLTNPNIGFIQWKNNSSSAFSFDAK